MVIGVVILVFIVGIVVWVGIINDCKEWLDCWFDEVVGFVILFVLCGFDEILCLLND